MCLAVPMKICSIQGMIAQCEASGVFRDVNLLLITDQDPKPGDSVLVHTGYAIQKLTEYHAQESKRAFERLQ